MITNLSLHSVFVTDIDEAKAFYIDKLGFVEHTDATMGDFRCCTVNHPDHPELEVALSLPGPPLDDEDAETVRRLVGKGAMHGGGLRVDDCRKTYEEVRDRGVEFLQEPADRPYGVEAVLRDNSGNWWVLVEPREFTQRDLSRAAAENMHTPVD